MAKKSTNHGLKKTILTLLGLSLIIATAFVFWPRQSVEVMELSPLVENAFPTGHTTISGVILKTNNEYHLILPDTRKIRLLVSDLDRLLNQPVTVEGVVIPPEGDEPGDMLVYSITLSQSL